MKCTAVVRGGNLVPEQVIKLHEGSRYTLSLSKSTERSIPQLRLYWSGLVGLMMDYWTPTEKLITTNENKLVMGMFKFMKEKQHITVGEYTALTQYASIYLEYLSEARADISLQEKVLKEDIHDWIKLHAGYYDLVATPTGVHKKPKSVAVDKMSQAEFNTFFEKAKQVCHKKILFSWFPDGDALSNAIEERLQCA